MMFDAVAASMLSSLWAAVDFAAGAAAAGSDQSATMGYTK